MTNTLIKQNVNRLKSMLENDSVKKQFKNALKENTGLFVASLIDLYSGDNYLAKADPRTVVQEALKAATLKLPINKQLGFAYIVPYKNKKNQQIAQFQLGYKGYIQLAMRTGQVKVLNGDMVYEGELSGYDKLTGEIKLDGEKTSNKVIGYFVYMQLINGFSKTEYMSKEQVEEHAKRYSQSYSYSSSAWQTNFDEMALKTVYRRLLSKHAPMSIEMASVFAADEPEDDNYGYPAEDEKDFIDIESTDSADDADDDEPKEPEF